MSFFPFWLCEELVWASTLLLVTSDTWLDVPSTSKNERLPSSSVARRSVRACICGLCVDTARPGKDKPSFEAAACLPLSAPPKLNPGRRHQTRCQQSLIKSRNFYTSTRPYSLRRKSSSSSSLAVQALVSECLSIVQLFDPALLRYLIYLGKGTQCARLVQDFGFCHLSGTPHVSSSRNPGLFTRQILHSWRPPAS